MDAAAWAAITAIVLAITHTVGDCLITYIKHRYPYPNQADNGNGHSTSHMQPPNG
jgi:hypothetical protein